MAGIGWRLDRLIGRGTLSGSAAAYTTGAAVMALPWALTTGVLAVFRFLLPREPAGAGSAEVIVTIACSVALLVDGPIQIVIARHTADRLYEGWLRAIAAPFFRGLGTVFLLGAACAGAVLVALGVPPGSAIAGGVVAAITGAQWTALSVGNGLCSPGRVLGAVGAGIALSLGLAGALAATPWAGLPGFLAALAAGQGLALAGLLAGIVRALPDEADESACLLPAFREYAALAGAGFSFNASLWIDKPLTWMIAGGEALSLHAAASTLAWFSTIPCLAWIFVEVETRFQRQVREFYRSLEDGASLTALRDGMQSLVGETVRLLRGAAAVQAGMTIFMQVAAGYWASWLHLPAAAVLPYRLLLASAGIHALALLGLVVLYYFDLRRDALAGALALLAGIATCTAAAAAGGLPPGAGTAIGCAAGTTVIWWRIARGIPALLWHTMLGQPFGAEHLDDALPVVRDGTVRD